MHRQQHRCGRSPGRCAQRRRSGVTVCPQAGGSSSGSTSIRRSRTVWTSRSLLELSTQRPEQASLRPLEATVAPAAGDTEPADHQAARHAQPRAFRREGKKAAAQAAAMRHAIAQVMAKSKREIPHYYLATSVDLEASMSWLQHTNAERPVTDRILPGRSAAQSIRAGDRRGTGDERLLRRWRVSARSSMSTSVWRFRCARAG